MGRYINPLEGTKEEFLCEFGTEISKEEAANFDYTQSDTLPVVWIDNGPFSAAGIAFDKEEMDDFQMEDDRPQRWYIVNMELLTPYL